MPLVMVAATWYGVPSIVGYGGWYVEVAMVIAGLMSLVAIATMGVVIKMVGKGLWLK